LAALAGLAAGGPEAKRYIISRRNLRAMNLFGWANQKIGKFTCIDMALTKFSVAAFTLMIAKLWPPLLSLDWYWYGLVFAILAILLLWNFLRA